MGGDRGGELFSFDLPEFMKQQMEAQRWQHESDPTKFPANVRVEDDALLMDFTTYCELRRRLEISQQLTASIGQSVEAARHALLAKLLERYPNVKSLEHPRMAIRQQGDGFYYVAW